MAAFILIAFSISVDLYKVGVRCIESGFSVSNIINALKEIQDSVRSEKYLKCIDEIYEDSNIHSIGIECIICRRKIKQTKMICNSEIENALEVDGCEEAFEVISRVSKISRFDFYCAKIYGQQKFHSLHLSDSKIDSQQLYAQM